jgi:hypothetical protein
MTSKLRKAASSRSTIAHARGRADWFSGRRNTRSGPEKLWPAKSVIFASRPSMENAASASWSATTGSHSLHSPRELRPSSLIWRSSVRTVIACFIEVGRGHRWRSFAERWGEAPFPECCRAAGYLFVGAPVNFRAARNVGTAPVHAVELAAFRLARSEYQSISRGMAAPCRWSTNWPPSL